MEDFSALLVCIKSRFSDRYHNARERSEKVEQVKTCSQYLYEILDEIYDEFIKSKSRQRAKKPQSWELPIEVLFKKNRKKPLSKDEKSDLQSNLSKLNQLVQFRHKSAHEIAALSGAKDLIEKGCDAIEHLLKVFNDRGFGSVHFPKIFEKLDEPAQRVLWIRLWRTVLNAEFQGNQEARIIPAFRKIPHLNRHISQFSEIDLKQLACLAIHDFPESEDYLVCMILEDSSISANLPNEFYRLKNGDNYKTIKREYESNETHNPTCSLIKRLIEVAAESPSLSVFEVSIVEAAMGDPNTESPESVFNLFGSPDADVIEYLANQFPEYDVEAVQFKNYVFMNKFWGVLVECVQKVPEDIGLYLSVRALAQMYNELDLSYKLNLANSLQGELKVEDRQRRVLAELMEWFVNAYSQVLGAGMENWTLKSMLNMDTKRTVSDLVDEARKVHYWSRLFSNLEPRRRRR